MAVMKDLVAGIPRYRHFINGQWVDSTGKEFLEVENPATQEIIATAPKGTADDGDRALLAARAAQPAWEALPPVERGQLLRRLAHWQRALAQPRTPTGWNVKPRLVSSVMSLYEKPTPKTAPANRRLTSNPRR